MLGVFCFVLVSVLQRSILDGIDTRPENNINILRLVLIYSTDLSFYDYHGMRLLIGTNKKGKIFAGLNGRKKD